MASKVSGTKPATFTADPSQRRHASSQASQFTRTHLSEAEAAVFRAVLDELPAALPEAETTEVTDGLFEDDADEDYTWAKSVSADDTRIASETTSPGKPVYLSAVAELRAAVEKGDYATAGRLLHELHAVGTHIPPSELYVRPLLNLLKDSHVRDHPLRQHTESLTDAFSAWFALIPDAEHVHDPTLLSLEEVRRHIFHTNLVDTQLVLTFGLAAARKGYAEQISSQLMHFVMGAFPHVHAALRYMDTFLNAAETYRRRQDARDSVFRPALSIRRKVYKTALRALVRNGHHDVAVDFLLQKKRNLAQSVLKETLQFVAGQLQKAQRFDLLAKVNPILEGMEDRSAESASAQVDVEAAYLQDIVDRQDSGVLEDGAIINDTLPAQLAYLRRAFSRSGTPPTCAVLVNFLDQYYDSGRRQAIRLLRQRAFRQGTAATTAYTFAQMVFLRRRKLDTLLIQSFASTFYLAGVPREPILRIIQTATTKPDTIVTKPGRAAKSISAGDTAAFVPSAREIRKKAWPDSMTTALVWHSVTALTVGWQAVQALYQQLLAFAAGDASADSGEGTPALPALAPRPAVRTEAFMPFIRRLMLGTSLEWGPRILQDMLRLGIAPTIYHFTDMAGVYARKNQIDRVMMIVDMVEGAAQEAGRADVGPSAGGEASVVPGSDAGALRAAQASSCAGDPAFGGVSGHQPRKAGAVPGADLIFYICVIRGFIIARNLEAALAIEERMWRHYDYQPGNPYYESYFKDLRRMQEHSRRRQQTVREKWHAKYGPELAQEKIDAAMKERSARVMKLYGLTNAEALNSVHHGTHGSGSAHRDSETR
ncbi:hypothetical protein HDZ31DRAFT_63072 [Schizophyllum fasciatum]